MTIIGPILPYC